MARRPGALSKNKVYLMNRLQEMYGDDFHPIMQMAKNAHYLQKEIDDRRLLLADAEKDAEHEPDTFAVKTVIDAWDKVAQYVQPKLKAIEISGTLELSELNDDELTKQLEDLADT